MPKVETLANNGNMDLQFLLLNIFAKRLQKARLKIN
jgi:hypothetical protein